MGCGLCNHALLNGDTDLTLRGTGLARYDSIFQEMERPLHKVQRAKELLSDSLFSFKASVGLYPRLPLSTFPDAVLAMLLCYSASSAGQFPAINLILTPELPYIHVNTPALQREHRPIPAKWDNLLLLAHQIRRELEGLTPIITAAANDILSLPEILAKAVSMRTMHHSSQFRVQLNHDKVVTAPTVLSESLDQANEVLQTAAGVRGVLEERKDLLETVGARAWTEKVQRPRELIEHYWPLG